MSRLVIYPFSMASQSSRDLRDALVESNTFERVMRVYPDRNYCPRADDLIINWGMGRMPEWQNYSATMLNHPEAVNVASNKLTALEKLKEKEVSIPSFTTDKEYADVNYDGIVVRHDLREHSGRGIELVTRRNQSIPDAPLYTELIDSKAEYRVHVFAGKVIDYIKKRRENDNEPVGDEKVIRSHQNGWIFTRENLRRLERVEQLAIESVEALGLDFGAVDIVMDQDGAVYTLEVNTAVAMENTTLDNYVNAIINYGNEEVTEDEVSNMTDESWEELDYNH